MKNEADFIEMARKDAAELADCHNGKGPPHDDILKLAVCVITLCDEVAALKKELATLATQSTDSN